MFFFFNDTATTEIYTLSLHDALPISAPLPGNSAPHVPSVVGHTPTTAPPAAVSPVPWPGGTPTRPGIAPKDRKSTRLNSSHANISYAVFCLKKKINIYFTYHVRTLAR